MLRLMSQFKAEKLEQLRDRERHLREKWTELHDAIRPLDAQVTAEEKRMALFRPVRGHPTSPLVFLAGKTGAGKSTLIGRFSPDKKVRDDPLAKGGAAPVGSGMESCTKTVALYDCVVGFRSMHILDPPGHNDTRGRDTSRGNSFAATVKGCGGYNFILMVMTIRDKKTPQFCSMIKFYRDIFGSKMYERMAIVVTGVDDPYVKEQYKEDNRQKDLERTFYQLTEGCKIPVIPIGHNNCEEAHRQLCRLIPYDKHEPENIKSPLDKLKKHVATKKSKADEKLKELRWVQNLVKKVKAEQREIDLKLRSL